jgi:hypothetical protein
VQRVEPDPMPPGRTNGPGINILVVQVNSVLVITFSAHPLISVTQMFFYGNLSFFFPPNELMI